MLYNLEPDASVTGGAWYSDQDFEAEFVDILNQQCFKFLQQKVYLQLNLAKLANFIDKIRQNQPYSDLKGREGIILVCDIGKTYT